MVVLMLLNIVLSTAMADTHYLTLVNKSPCTLSFVKDSSMHAKWVNGHSPEDQGNLPAYSSNMGSSYPQIILEAVKQCSDDNCNSHNKKLTYFLSCPEGENDYTNTVNFKWVIYSENNLYTSLTSNLGYKTTLKAPDYSYGNNLTFTSSYSDKYHTTWTISQTKPENGNTLSLGDSGNLTPESATSDPSDSTGVVNANAVQILGINKTDTSGNCPSWACVNGKTKGIYRISFSYQMYPTGAGFSSHPPVVGAFEIEQGGEVIGSVKRDYAFIYRNDPDINGISKMSDTQNGAVYLQDSFVYVQNPSDSYNSIEIQGGYYDAENTFNPIGSSVKVDLNAATEYSVTGGAPLINFSLNEDGDDASSSYAAIIKNGQHQVRVIPELETGTGGAVIQVQTSSTTAKQSNVYQHMLYIDYSENQSGSVITNYVPATADNAIDQNFESSYLRSRYYCAITTDSVGTVNYDDVAHCYDVGNQNISSSDDDMSSYPPKESSQNPDIPTYLSLRPSANQSETSYSLSPCYVYYDSADSQVVHGCAYEPASSNDQELKLFVEKGSSDINDSGNNFLSLAFAYAASHISVIGSFAEDGGSELGVNPLDPVLTIADNNGSSILDENSTDANFAKVMSNEVPCYLYFLKHNNLQPLNNFQAIYYFDSYFTNLYVEPNSVGDCGAYNDTLKGVNSDTWVGDTLGNQVNLSDKDGHVYSLSPTQNANGSSYVTYSGGSSNGAYHDFNDNMTLLTGWPLWNSWYNSAFPDTNGGSVNNNNEPFMLMENAVSSTMENGKKLSYDVYTHFDYAQYSENNLVVPFPAYAALAKDNAQGDVGCSFLYSNDKNNISAFVNSWCEYLSPISTALVNGNDVSGNALTSTQQNANMEAVLPSMDSVWIGGGRDILGDYLAPVKVGYQS